MKTVIITGGTGLIGSALAVGLLKKGYRVVVFTRGKSRHRDEQYSFCTWNPEKRAFDPGVISQADYIVNLAGANIASGRWTAKRRKEIYDSRVDSSKTIVKALSDIPNNAKAVISASAIGFYGKSDGKILLAESTPSGESYLSHVCRDWENEISKVESLGKRRVIMRTGVVLDVSRGAYPKMTRPLNFGFAPLIGSGKEVIAWIHIKDLCSIYIEAIENENFSGVYNACSPRIITGKEFMLVAAKVKGKRKPIILHTPLFLLRAILGKVVDEALLQNARIDSEKIINIGVKFQFPTIEEAIKDLAGVNIV